MRAIANLCPESFHVLVRDGSKFSVIRDLKRRRVSLDEKGAGALFDARLVFRAFGLRERHNFKLRYLKGDVASAQLVAGKLDAFIIVA
ncbi:MAG: TAXI family TRAP transporter solute-binding subunit, partial [Pseudomonadota bacterium]|nr:TAXI family TRAP transporter solute-binding subunit [Pseudomonadota bacterium]